MKIILFILLALLCLFLLFLFVVALVLLNPIRYEISGAYEKKYHLSIRVFWFFKCIKFIYAAENGDTKMELKAFGRVLTGGEQTESEDTGDEEPSLDDAPSPAEEDTPVSADDTPISADDSVPDPGSQNKSSDSANDEKLHEKIERITQNIADKLEQAKQIINYPDRDKIIELVIKTIKRLLNALKVDRFRLSGEFGFEDPSLTGQCLGMLSIFTGLFGLTNAIQMKGSFEKPALSFTANGNGSFTLFSLIWPLAALVLSKPVWKIVKPFLFPKKRKKKRPSQKTPDLERMNAK